MRSALIVLAGLTCVGLGYERLLPQNAGVSFTRVAMAIEDVETLSPENANNFVEFYVSRSADWPQSTARFHNLGNAHFLAEHLPEAILCYHHGLRLDPNDRGLYDNLDYARARVQYPFGDRGRPEVDSWPPWLYRPSPFQAFVTALFLYSVACLLATRWFMTRRRALMVRAVVVLVLAMIGGSFWLYLENESARQDQHPLVVIRRDKLALRKGNGPSYALNPDLPFLSSGMEARKIHERGGWMQIQFASGEVGWVERSAVLVEKL